MRVGAKGYQAAEGNDQLGDVAKHCLGSVGLQSVSDSDHCSAGPIYTIYGNLGSLCAHISAVMGGEGRLQPPQAPGGGYKACPGEGKGKASC